jgi:hypothetical protein
MMSRIAIFAAIIVVLSVPTVRLALAATPGNIPAATPSGDTLELNDDLRGLTEAWNVGGGQYGYPFWEKAGHRWRASELSTSAYREYVVGYRDRLDAGCKLLSSVDTRTDLGDELQDRLVAACTDRVRALDAHQRELELLILRDASPEQIEDMAEWVESRNDERDTFNRLLQGSYAATRTSMDLAQAALEGEGLARLPEDAFI